MNIGVILIIFCLLSFSFGIIISGIKSIGTENIKDDNFTKEKQRIRNNYNIFYGIVILLILLFLLYKEI